MNTLHDAQGLQYIPIWALILKLIHGSNMYSHGKERWQRLPQKDTHTHTPHPSHPKAWPCLTPSQNIPKQEPIRPPPSHDLPPLFAWRGDSPMRAAQQNLAERGRPPASPPVPLSTPGWGTHKGLSWFCCRSRWRRAPLGQRQVRHMKKFRKMATHHWGIEQEGLDFNVEDHTCLFGVGWGRTPKRVQL